MGQTALRRIKVAPAPANLFADASTGMVQLQPLTMDVTTDLKVVARDLLTSDQDHFGSIIGERDASLKFSLEAKGMGAAVAQASEGEATLLLKSCFGNQTADFGTTAGSGSTTGNIVYGGGSLSLYGFFGWVDPATGLYNVRQITGKAGGLSPCRALPNAPANSAFLYASQSFTKAVAGHQHLWFDAEWYDPSAAVNRRRYLRGGLGSVSLKAAALQKLAFEFDFKCVDWDDSQQGVAMNPAAYLPSQSQRAAYVRNSRFWVDGTAYPFTAFDFDLANTIEPQVSSAAPNGVARFFVKDSGLKTSVTCLWSDTLAALETKWKAHTTFDMLVELTEAGPGNSIAIAAPVVEISGAKMSSVNGLDAVTYTLNILRNDVTARPAVTFGLV